MQLARRCPLFPPSSCSKPGLCRPSKVTRRATLVKSSNEPSKSTKTADAVPEHPETPKATASPQQLAADGSNANSTDGNGTSRRPVREAQSTDAVASFLSRRFGLVGGLAWVGILAVGTIGEQVKTRMEVAAEKAGTQDVTNSKTVTLPSGVTYRDLRVGGGQQPIKGYLVLLDYIGRANGVEFENTRKRGKPVVFLYGSRPFTGGICAGIEQGMASMKAGGKRVITVPPEAGFGDKGFTLRPTEHVPDKQGIIPPGAALEYELELVRVSIPPS